MPADLEERLERAAESLPAPDEVVSARARAYALGALAEAHQGHAAHDVIRPRRRGGLIAGAGAIAAAAAAVLLVLAAPWQGSNPLATERALAAIGDLPVIHAVVERTRPSATVIDLASGDERPHYQRTEYWYDDERALLRARITVDGQFLTELLQTRKGGFSDLGPVPGQPVEPQLDPALAGFASRYREALESGRAEVIGDDVVDGHKAVLLRITLRPATDERPTVYQEVAVDAETYRPLRFRFHSGAAVGEWWRVLSLETVAREEGQFAAPAPAAPRPSRLTGSDERVLTPAEAAASLERPALWPGPAVAGIELSEIELMKVTTEWTDGRETENRALVFQYGQGRRAGPSGQWLTITEGTSPQEIPHFGAIARPALAPGQLRLVGLGDLDGSAVDMWFGAMEINGVSILLESPQRKLILAAARAMVPIR